MKKLTKYEEATLKVLRNLSKKKGGLSKSGEKTFKNLLDRRLEESING